MCSSISTACWSTRLSGTTSRSTGRCALFGFDITRYEHLSDYNGLPTRKKLQMLSVEKGLPAALHNTLNRLKQVYTRDEILTRCRPVFEKEYMLSRLRKEGYRMAVCSNSIRESLQMMIHQSGLDEYFEFLVSNEDVTRPKPDPEIYTTAMAQAWRVAPAETIIVEDSPHGHRSRTPVGCAHLPGVRVHRRRLFQGSRRDRSRRTSPADGNGEDRRRNGGGGVIQIVVPMGGEGRQFAERGYTFPKPLVEVAGQPLIEIVVRNLTPSCDHQFVFVCRQEHIQSYALGDVLQLVAPGCRIVTMAKPTAGALCSVLLGMEHLEHEDELLVANADQWIDGPIDSFLDCCACEPVGRRAS